jgi:hypothetical protein
VIARRDVADSKIQARGNIIIQGAVTRSNLSGADVSAHTLSGSTVTARDRVTVDSVEPDEHGTVSRISVGITDFYRQRIRENETYIAMAKENLARLENLLGSEIVENVDPNNLQVMLLKFLAGHRHGKTADTREEIEKFRHLLASVYPTRALINAKEEENYNLRRRIEDDSDSEQNMIIVREKLNCPTVLSVGGVQEEMEPSTQPATVSRDNSGHLSVAPEDPENF